MEDEKNRAQLASESARNEVKKRERYLNELAPMISKVQRYAGEYLGDVEDVLPEVGMMESSKSYRENKAKPFFVKMMSLVRSFYAAYLDVNRKFARLQDNYNRLVKRNDNLSNRVKDLVKDNKDLKIDVDDFLRVKRVFGNERINMVIEKEKAQEQLMAAEKCSKQNEHNYDGR